MPATTRIVAWTVVLLGALTGLAAAPALGTTDSGGDKCAYVYPNPDVNPDECTAPGGESSTMIMA
jgi:hypothetical protein